MSVVTAVHSVAVSLSTVAVVDPPPETSSAGATLVTPRTSEGLSNGALGVIVVFSVLFLILGPAFLYLWHHRRNRDYWFYPFRRRHWPGTSSTYSYDSYGSYDDDKGAGTTRPRPPNDFPPHVSFRSEVEMKSAPSESSVFSEGIAAGSSKTKPARNRTATTVEEELSIHSIRPVQSPSRDRPSRKYDRSSRESSFTITNLRSVKGPSRDRPPSIPEESIRPSERQRSFSLSILDPVNHPSRTRSSRRPRHTRDRDEVPQTSFSISQLPPAPHRSISRRNTSPGSPRSVDDNRVGASSDSELDYYHSRMNRTATGRRESKSVPVIVAEDPRAKDKSPSQESYYSSSGFSLSTLEPPEPSRRQRSPVRYRSTTSKHARVEDVDFDTWSISSIGTAPNPSRRSPRPSRR